MGAMLPSSGACAAAGWGGPRMLPKTGAWHPEPDDLQGFSPVVLISLEEDVMPAPDPAFSEAAPWSRPIRDLGLSIAGSALEPILAELEAERLRVGLRKIRPRYYLTTEWGVPEG